MNGETEPKKPDPSFCLDVVMTIFVALLILPFVALAMGIRTNNDSEAVVQAFDSFVDHLNPKLVSLLALIRDLIMQDLYYLRWLFGAFYLHAILKKLCGVLLK